MMFHGSHFIFVLTKDRVSLPKHPRHFMSDDDDDDDNNYRVFL